MRTQHHQRQQRVTTGRSPLRKRRGILSIELLLILPIFFVVLMAVFEFSMLFFARSSVVQASRVAARRAALGAQDLEEIEEEVRRILKPSLQPNLIVQFIPAERSGDVTTVSVQVPMANAAPDMLWGLGFSLEDQYLTEETSVIRE